MWLAALPLIIKALPGIVSGVEAIFSKKPKSGKEKLPAAVSVVQNLLQVAGHIPLPTKDEAVIKVIEDLINVVVADLNASGALSPPTAAGQVA